jgi:hypothetical protein
MVTAFQDIQLIVVDSLKVRVTATNSQPLMVVPSTGVLVSVAVGIVVSIINIHISDASFGLPASSVNVPGAT